MYDLVLHLIYLDNFSEEKTNKTSLGEEIPFPSDFQVIFSASLAPRRGTKWSPYPAPGALLWVEACVQFFGCTRPAEGCQID